MFAVLFHPTSYLGIIIFLMLTGCGMPLPEELAIVVAGVLSAQEHLVWQKALAACLIGAILGDSIIYFIGYRWGNSLLSSHPRIAKLLNAENEKKFEAAIRKHALKVMLAARFMVGIRGPVYLAAGAVRIPYRTFLMIDLLCATLVVNLFFWLAYWFGEGVLSWIKDAEWVATGSAVLAAIIVGFFVYRHNRRKISESVIPANGGTTEKSTPSN